MAPMPSGDNVLLTYENSIYTLSIKESTYQWEMKPKKLLVKRKNHIQHVVPAYLVFSEKENENWWKSFDTSKGGLLDNSWAPIIDKPREF